MASIYSNISENKIKTAFLMAAFSALLLLLGYLVSLYFNNYYIVYFSAIAAIFTNAFAFWFSDKIALRSVGAIPADEEKYKELHNIVENLSITAGIPKPKVYIIPDNAPNAFATGRDPKHAAVAVTEGLLNILDRSELEGVIAHELSHIKNRDILVMTVAVVLVGIIANLTDFIFRFGLWNNSENDNSNSKNPILFILFIVAIILAPIFAQLLQFAVSRKREFLADSSGALLTRYPEGLAKALIKISSYGAPMQRASQATAHLFIANPFGENRSKFSSFVSKLFSTHPPVEERIKALLDERASEFLPKEN